LVKEFWVKGLIIGKEGKVNLGKKEEGKTNGPTKGRISSNPRT